MQAKKWIIVVALSVLVSPGYSAGQIPPGQTQSDDLRLASYVTSRQVEQLATDEAQRTRAWQTIQRMGLRTLYLEVYRGGHVVSIDHLKFVRDWVRDKGLSVVGGIATVPGGEFGVRQEGPLGWFNWQAPKTQQDLTEVMRRAASVFDRFIVDDFLCTGDVSAQSRAAKGQRSWGEYRRALLTDLAQSVFVGPAKAVNPDITMIVKYPQWYDRFHLFGYDTETLPRIFDQVWVGTETRGRSTQRFGFVQPYEGFVNYRWLASIAGPKIGGAWFDHGDCAEYDFLDQAYTSVLAGARELVLFNFGNVMAGHPDHEKLRTQFDALARLAAFVRAHPVVGVPAYKPPNSEPGGDMYIMDFLGMLGVPIIPVSEFPQAAPVIFLPAQAGADPDLLRHVQQALTQGAQVIVTTSLLVGTPDGDELTRMLGIDVPLQSSPCRARLIPSSPSAQAQPKSKIIVDIESPIEALPGLADIRCSAGGKELVLLTRTKPVSGGSMALLNTHTFNQADFDAVGEVLLCPRRLGLLDLPEPALTLLRAAFHPRQVRANATPRSQDRPVPAFSGPGNVCFHPLADGHGSSVVQNFNDQAVDVQIQMGIPVQGSSQFREVFSGKAVDTEESNGKTVLTLSIPARDRIWVQRIH
jgi:hypothetical protein